MIGKLNMTAKLSLLQPGECALILIDQQAGFAFAVGSEDREALLNNVIALARTASAFSIPIIASTSATKVYGGPLMPALQAASGRRRMRRPHTDKP
jgi:nicotinamidase-related amidase